MSNKNDVDSLRSMLADAIMVGAKLAQHDYAHDLQDPKGRYMKDEIDCLYKSTQNFLNSNGLDALSAQQIFPVYEEIQQLVDKQV